MPSAMRRDPDLQAHSQHETSGTPRAPFFFPPMDPTKDCFGISLETPPDVSSALDHIEDADARALVEQRLAFHAEREEELRAKLEEQDLELARTKIGAEVERLRAEGSAALAKFDADIKLRNAEGSAALQVPAVTAPADETPNFHFHPHLETVSVPLPSSQAVSIHTILTRLDSIIHSSKTSKRLRHLLESSIPALKELLQTLLKRQHELGQVEARIRDFETEVEIWKRMCSGLQKHSELILRGTNRALEQTVGVLGKAVQTLLGCEWSLDEQSPLADMNEWKTRTQLFEACLEDHERHWETLEAVQERLELGIEELKGLRGNRVDISSFIVEDVDGRVRSFKEKISQVRDLMIAQLKKKPAAETERGDRMYPLWKSEHESTLAEWKHDVALTESEHEATLSDDAESEYEAARSDAAESVHETALAEPARGCAVS